MPCEPETGATRSQPSRIDFSLGRYCRGLTPLTPRLEPWMVCLVAASTSLIQQVEEHGSPVHVVTSVPFRRNGRQLLDVARAAGVRLGLYFARKANKALTFVDAARRLGWGVDVAGYEELAQVLERGMPAQQLVVTAAVKPRRLLQLAAEHGVTVALDNAFEARALAERVEGPLDVALRLSGFWHRGEKLFSRFGFDIDDDLSPLWSEVGERLRIRGLHFHLDGYDPDQRVSAIDQCLEQIERRPELRDVRFLDIGGGLPVRYLEDEEQWLAFWHRLEAALLGEADPVTYRNHGLGLLAVDGRIAGRAVTYPFFQERVASSWLEHVLAAETAGGTVAERLRARDLELRLEPGRSLLDGCGLTVARVEWTKRHPAGHGLVGLEMNRTQCRTGSADYLVDPLLVMPAPRPRRLETPVTYLTGAYCIENEMLSWRGFRFPHGIEPGDLVVWPNTAGYFMHFLESRSHQLPLAKNLVYHPETGLFERDAIDSIQSREADSIMPRKA